MNGHDHDTKPADVPDAAGLGAKPQAAAPGGVGDTNRLWALTAEIIALPESAENMARLRQLHAEFDAERLRQINEILEMEQKQRLPRRLEAQETIAEVMQPLDQAMKRPDLTVPEMLFLIKLQLVNTARLLESLHAEKKQLEQNRKPNRGCRQGRSE
jgi:hypothetical protein